MTIRVRAITQEERDILDNWQRRDDLVRYRRARIVLLSAERWTCARIATALALHVETVRWVIKSFNEGGIAAITPQPRSGGRPPSHGEEAGEMAEDLIRQGPPAEEDRATWTLHSLARAIAAGLGHKQTLSHEGVRRLLEKRRIRYWRAKEWLTSPDPLYALHKRQRDWLLALARQSPDGVAVWLDQSWFTRWPYRFHNWAQREQRPRVAKRWSESVQTTALYAALDDVRQTAFLDWADGQPNSDTTVAFLERLMAHWTSQRKRFIVLFWDRAPWHTSRRTRAWIRAYNTRAKSEGLTRLIVCFLPIRSPWLMPLESIFGWIKHQLLGDRFFATVTDLQQAVERSFHRRVRSAQQRRHRTYAKSLTLAPSKSMSVL